MYHRFETGLGLGISIGNRSVIGMGIGIHRILLPHSHHQYNSTVATRTGKLISFRLETTPTPTPIPATLLFGGRFLTMISLFRCIGSISHVCAGGERKGGSFFIGDNDNDNENMGCLLPDPLRN